MTPLLSFAKVRKRYPDGARELLVLDEVSFQIEAGSAVGLYGARREGKSTLLRLAAAIEAPDGGAIVFDGRDVTQISTGDRARLLRGPIALLSAAGWVPTPEETVLDHVAMSLGSDGLTLKDAKRRALAALEVVGVGAVDAAQRTASLSSDVRARVMLARALVREPKLLIVDEPAPMPSLSDRDRFCALLRSSAREREIALLLASEDLSALQGMNVLMSISAGELVSSVESGTVVQLPRRRAAGGSQSST
jgi:ABC-type lipoprotein export system ATPase subunit